VRETIESIAVAVVLAFLFRAFVAEAFVIPTGSMAPTLQGRHMDVVCEKCQLSVPDGCQFGE
jgi:signal peptidase I